MTSRSTENSFGDLSPYPYSQTSGRLSTAASRKIEYEEMFEKTDLYKAIEAGSRESLQEAFAVINDMKEKDIRQKSEINGNSYMHHLVGRSGVIKKKTGDLIAAVPLLYRLSMAGIDVNARNNVGNTCLHMACFKPYADQLFEHLIRIGCDPAISNIRGCKVIHCYNNRTCQMVKGQPKAQSGIWSAVAQENYSQVEQYMKSWVRVRIRRGKKSLKDICEATGNLSIMKLLEDWEYKNECIHSLLSGDIDRTKHTFREAGKNIVNTTDESYEVPKPLIVALEELGDIYKKEVQFLIDNGAEPKLSYEENLQNWRNAFHTSELYQKIKEASEESLLDALNLIDANNVNVKLRSFQPKDEGYTYLHLVSGIYYKTEERLRKYLLRLIYKFALAGIDVNARDKSGSTALMKSYIDEKQDLIYHMLRIGCDSSIGTPDGWSLAMENYQYKGKITKNKGNKRKDQPGLWVAVEDQNIEKAERCLKGWCRVNITKVDRTLKEVSMAMQCNEMTSLLEEYEHTNEFVCAVFACDMHRIKNLLALGKRKCNVNPINPVYTAGFRPDFSAEYVCRPLIIPAFEICTPEVVEILIKFGADLSSQYEEREPCGPTAFWAFQDYIDSEITFVVAHNANVKLRDERGATMLHKAMLRKDFRMKPEIIQILLDRHIDIAARDVEGYTARDYVGVYDLDNKHRLRQLIDDHVVFKVTNDEVYNIEQLMLDSYDHILDVKGGKKNKGVRELAYLKNYKEMMELLDDMATYSAKVQEMLQACRAGDITYVSKNCQEKRLIWGKDKGGRSTLHLAVLYGHANIVQFLCQQFHGMVKTRDNLLRTPLHYAVCHKDRKKMYAPIALNGGETSAVDANNLSVHDYNKELEKETPCKEKPRGRQFYDYKVRNLIEKELYATDRFLLNDEMYTNANEVLDNKISVEIKENNLVEQEKEAIEGVLTENIVDDNKDVDINENNEENQA